MIAGHSSWGFLSNSGRSPELIRAQYSVLAKQIPLMYAIVVINMIALTFTHHSHAPAILTIFIPAVICMLCIFRGIRMAVEKHQKFPLEKIRKRMEVTVILAVILGGGIVGWALALFGYGDA